MQKRAPNRWLSFSMAWSPATTHFPACQTWMPWKPMSDQKYLLWENPLKAFLVLRRRIAVHDCKKLLRSHANMRVSDAAMQETSSIILIIFFLPQRKRSNCNEILQHAKNESRILSKVNIYWLSTATAFSPNKSNVRITICEARGWIDWARIKGSAWRTATCSFAKATVAKHAWWYAKATHRGEKWSADNSENYYFF